MKYPLYNQEGEKTGEVTLPKEVFGQKMNEDLLHQAIMVEEANRRQPAAHTKTRKEVSGGGRKPWRQKGTGRARAGSNRSPIWIGGGVTFGPRKEKDFKKKMNQRMRNKALAVALSNRTEEKALKIVDSLSIAEGKTKLLTPVLTKLKLIGTTLLLLEENDNKLVRAGKNLPSLQVQLARQVRSGEILKFKNLLLTKKAIKVLETRLS
jgi:large subunit ribosomal protein L4